MQFIDLQRQQERIRQQLWANIAKVLQHGKYIDGPEVAQLEGHLEAMLENRCRAVCCGNGTDAIQLVCMALGLQPGDEVITTPLSFMSTVEVPLLLGLRPVFVEVEAATGNLDAANIEAAIGPRTKLILPVSLYGQCANYSEIDRIASCHGIPVLEDGAESFGARHRGQLSGTLTELATSSFFPAKPLGCYGDGGVVFVRANDQGDKLGDKLGDKFGDELAAKIRRIAHHGQNGRYRHSDIGLNSRLDTLQAAVLLAKLEVFADEHRRKQQIAQRYYQALRGKVGLLEVQQAEQGNESAHGYFPILSEQRTALRAALERAQIPYSQHFPCLHTQPALQGLGYSEGDFPIAERIARQVITIPMHPYLYEQEIEQVINCIVQNS